MEESESGDTTKKEETMDQLKDKDLHHTIIPKKDDEDELKPMTIGGGNDDDAVADPKSSWRTKLSSSSKKRRKLFLKSSNASRSSLLEDDEEFPPKYKLLTEQNARKYSMWTLQFAVLCSAISTKMLNPNYAIMCSGDHPDSFPSIDPFGFNSATYFLPMCSLLGVAISSTFIGTLSDKVGRKQPLLWMAVVSAFGNIAKYYTRHTFWGFSIANFIFGFFLGNLPIAMAYVGDVFSSKVDKQKKLGELVGNFVMGNSGGGMIAILMNSSGLFAPLWVGAGLMALSSILIATCLIEPGDARLDDKDDSTSLVNLMEEEEEEEKRPDTINKPVMWNIILGALADNFGSTALFPMCLSPLALEQYTLNFLNANPPQNPIMSVTGYQWLSVCVALLVVPSTMLTPYVFDWIGPSGCCVFGNCFTGVLTICLLIIAGYAPATELAFVFFVLVLYGGFPMTVFSQLTTGPMLDVIAPEDKLGFVQGLNNSAMNFGMALAPWLFGILADATTTNISIWTGIAISFLAGAINAPLIWNPSMGPPPKRIPSEKKHLPTLDEEEALVEQALRGSFVDPEALLDVNMNRLHAHKKFIVPAVKPYSEDRRHLAELHSHAMESFRFRREFNDRVLEKIALKKSGSLEAPDISVEELCQLVNASNSGDPNVIKQTTQDLGEWIALYLRDNGYNPHTNSLLIKQMVTTAFPAILPPKITTGTNVEDGDGQEAAVDEGQEEHAEEGKEGVKDDQKTTKNMWGKKKKKKQQQEGAIDDDKDDEIPLITEFTPDNIEHALLKSRSVMDSYLEHEEKKRYGYKNILGTGYRPQFWT